MRLFTKACTIPAVLATAMVALGVQTGATAQGRKVRVVATLPTYASIAQTIGGSYVETEAIARGDVDPHFVNPRPSFAAMLQRADVFITTGLDLELWVPALLDRANNSAIAEGSAGHVVAYAGITLRDVPASVSRAGGDVHAFGNPHIHTDPINVIYIARNIAAGLTRVDPDHASDYEANLETFRHHILVRLFGAELVGLIGDDATLTQLASGDGLWAFLETQQYQGRPLASYVGGWLAQGAPLRDKQLVCYHKNWSYFAARFRFTCAMYVEPQPGIPPSPGHVRTVIDFIQQNKVPAILAANYYSRTQVEQVANRTGAAAVIIPFHERGEPGVDRYDQLVDIWLERLLAVVR